MDQERFGRWLSLALVPCSLVLVVLAGLLGDVALAAIGVVSLGTAVVLYLESERLFDPNVEFDLQEDHSFVAVLVQLGLSLLGFTLLVYLVGDVRAMTSMLRTGVPSPAYPAYFGAAAGVILGGGVAALTQRSNAFAEWTQSVPVSMVGHSLTFGTFLALLIYQPPSSLVYATAYTSSRLAVVFGVYLRS